MRYYLTFLASICAALILFGCNEQPDSQRGRNDTAPYIVAMNNPLLYFAHRLAGDTIAVRMLAPHTIDPAQWQPDVEAALQLQRAQLVLLNGAGYSSWLDKVSISPHKLVVTSAPVKEEWIPLEKQVTHSHGPQGAHAHGDYAFTTWMDMSQAQVQARSVAEALKREWPELQGQIEGNLDALTSDLQALDTDYREWAAGLAGRQVIYSHPIYQYFERRYQLPGHSLHWEPDEMPSEAQWRELTGLLTPGAIFIWEAEPLPAVAERLQSMGLDQVTIDPGASGSNIDWLTLQQKNLEQLKNL